MPLEIVLQVGAGLLATGVTGVVGYTAAKVVDLHREVGEIKTTVMDHVTRENSDRETMIAQMDDIKKRLPNGELHEALSILRKMTKKPKPKTGARK